MKSCRPCGCKGIRTCLICEKDCGIKKDVNIDKENGTYVYCPFCNNCWPGWEGDAYKTHPDHSGNPLPYPGIYIQLDFLTETEESLVSHEIEKIPWDLSQSGRRKQNFGPKCNFKKKKLQCGNFKGFPVFSRLVQDKFKSVKVLEDFQTIEQCSLEYDPERGASIDPHIDDCWVWGERVVTVNLMADSVLTMTYNDKPSRYNLDLVSTYPKMLDENGGRNSDGECFNVKNDLSQLWPVVRIPMPRRSLLVMYGAARYEWEHRILREDIEIRRICLAYREFTPPYLSGGSPYAESKHVLELAKNFQIL